MSLLDAVFISDLHLNPTQPEITQKFEAFIRWAADNTRSIYILGDFFHVWAGDDTKNEWTDHVAQQLASLSKKGIRIYYMHGNRDFLLGEAFAKTASMEIIKDPTVINLNGERVLLTHGDRYCTLDKPHQWLRRLTRNWLFTNLFLRIPYRYRTTLVSQVRDYSKNNRNKPSKTMEIVDADMLSHMRHFKAKAVIHGHIHQPGLIQHQVKKEIYDQYVLSDWDDKPLFLCYYKSKGFYFTSI